jgi:predicted MFS family arabinose efflux permease
MDISVAVGAVVSGFLTKNIGFTQTFIFFGFMCMMSYMSYRFVLKRQLVMEFE